MRRLAVVVPFVLAVLAPLPAAANVVVTIDKSTQRMSVAVDGSTRYNFAVSTGRAGYGTPSGTYHPERLARTWFSKKYYNSPMPHSICVRLHPSNAATLYALVQSQGAGNTRIVITGSSPSGSAVAQARAHPQWNEGAYDPRQPYPSYQSSPSYPYVERPAYRYDRGWQ